MNTGSPHHVQMVDDLEHYNVKENGAALRYGALYGAAGSNINFVKKNKRRYFFASHLRKRC